ncbi:MAG: conjugal transfer protein TraD [Prevotella sp.]|nr:conjugal transfer protein TraD [Prevotella sp.]
MNSFPIRFVKAVIRLWRSLCSGTTDVQTGATGTPLSPEDIIGKSHYKMTAYKTNDTVPAQQTAIAKQSVAATEDDVTFAGVETEKENAVRVSEDNLDDVFTDIPVSELVYNEDEKEERNTTLPATGLGFDDIDLAVKTIKKERPADEELVHAGRVFSDLDGTELFEKIQERMSDEVMSDKIADAIAAFVDSDKMQRTRQQSGFVLPDNIDDFDIRNYM